MADEETWISVGQAAARLGLHADKVRALADQGRLRSWRPPATGPGHAHRRVHAGDVEELRQEMREPRPPEPPNV